MEKTMAVNVKMAGSDESRNVMKSMAQGRKRGHVTIWQDILRDVRSQWTQAEHGSSYRNVHWR